MVYVKWVFLMILGLSFALLKYGQLLTALATSRHLDLLQTAIIGFLSHCRSTAWPQSIHLTFVFTSIFFAIVIRFPSIV